MQLWALKHKALEYSGERLDGILNELRRFIGRVARRRGVDCDAPSSAPRWETLEANFRTASGLEIRFFDMGLRRPRPVED